VGNGNAIHVAGTSSGAVGQPAHGSGVGTREALGVRRCESKGDENVVHKGISMDAGGLRSPAHRNAFRAGEE
jgi:hypothetical protein